MPDLLLLVTVTGPDWPCLASQNLLDTIQFPFLFFPRFSVSYGGGYKALD